MQLRDIKMTKQNTYKMQNTTNNIQVPGVTLFGGYARFPIFYLNLLRSIYG